MTSKLRSVAETRFAALTRREDAAMTSVDETQRATREKTERLRSLRLATQAENIADNTRQLKAKRRANASA